MMRAKLTYVFLLSVFLAFFTSCESNKEDEMDPENSGPTTLSVRLMDEPGDFEHVYIEVLDVMVNYETDDPDDEGGWQSLDAINTGVYDILELTGGVDVELVDNYEVEPGILKQIRLILGDQNSVVIDGEELPLTTPSAQQSGLKIKLNEELEPGFNYTFLLDFVVEESIVIAGNSGNIILKPVIRASLEASSGSISGTVSPDGLAVEVVADNGETVGSAMTDDSGNFLIAGLDPGTYTLTITPDPDSGFDSAELEGIEVVVGQITDVGEIELQQLPGSISGVALPADVMVSITADNGTEQVTVESNESGEFLIQGLQAGIYLVTLVPEAGSGLTEQVINDVEVLPGQNTDLGEITLQ